MKRLEAIVGPENFLTGDHAAVYAVCGLAPRAVVLPGAREEVSAIVRLAEEAGWSIVPWGGGTLKDAGSLSEPPDLVLATRRLKRLVDYQPDDMTITLEPGITLTEVSDLLLPRKQLLPLDPPLPDAATVGGIVASAASGPSRAGYGSPRDWLIGCRVIGSGGRETRGGGQVVKNAAGYDLPRLYTGSWGSLGVLVELTFKVTPCPEALGYAAVRLADADAAERMLAATLHSDLQPVVLELTNDPSVSSVGRPFALFFQFAHSREAVAWQQRELCKVAGEQGGEYAAPGDEEGTRILSGLRNLPARGELLCRIATLSSRLPALAWEAARICGADCRITARAANGQLFLSSPGQPPPELGSSLRALADDAGARCVFLRVPPAWRGRVEPWGAWSGGDRLMRSIKCALDPAGVFSRGRIVDCS